jgi:hypothetical protein
MHLPSLPPLLSPSRLLSAFALSPFMAEKTNCLIVFVSLFSAQLATLLHVCKLLFKTAKNKLTNFKKPLTLSPPTTNQINIMQNAPTKEEITALIEATKGKFFSLTFVKKDGTIRTINAKDRFTGLVKGTGSPATDALRQDGYMFAVDRNRNGYFCFKPEKVLLFKCGKIDKQFSSVVA